jgi:hypothetical protein
MFKLSLLKAACLVLFLGLLVGNAGAQTSLTLDLSDSTYTNWTDTCPASGPGCSGGYWKNTYNENVDSLRFGKFILSHSSAYEGTFWAGFTTGCNGDNFNYTLPCLVPPCYEDSTHTASQGWVCNQWGVMAGGGLVGMQPYVQQGAPYLIGYWDYYSDGLNPNSHSLEVRLADNALFTPKEVYICNHPWPYYGNIQGDGFARPLTDFGEGAHFDLIIHAVKADDTETSFTVPLAVVKNGDVSQYPIWQQIPFPPRLSDTKLLYFTMYSVDTLAGYGPNTAVYFNMDKLTVEVTGKTATSPTVQKAQTLATPQMIHVTDYFPLTSYTGGDVVVYDAKGKEVWRTTVKAGEKINLSKLPSGDYRLRHGHRVIPFKKVN